MIGAATQPHARSGTTPRIILKRGSMAPNYQVQRPATARLARGRGSGRVRMDADRPRRALYVSPVRCNAELGGTAFASKTLAVTCYHLRLTLRKITMTTKNMISQWPKLSEYILSYQRVGLRFTFKPSHQGSRRILPHLKSKSCR